jgi:hypothetical protein
VLLAAMKDGGRDAFDSKLGVVSEAILLAKLICDAGCHFYKSVAHAYHKSIGSATGNPA